MHADASYRLLLNVRVFDHLSPVLVQDRHVLFTAVEDNAMRTFLARLRNRTEAERFLDSVSEFIRHTHRKPASPGKEPNKPASNNGPDSSGTGPTSPISRDRQTAAKAIQSPTASKVEDRDISPSSTAVTALSEEPKGSPK